MANSLEYGSRVASPGREHCHSPVKGEAIVAFVTLKSSARPSPELAEELRQHVRKTIGPIASPDHVYFARLLPKTRSGKIMRRVIKAAAANAEIGDLSTLEDDGSVDEVKAAIDALREAEKNGPQRES